MIGICFMKLSAATVRYNILHVESFFFIFFRTKIKLTKLYSRLYDLPLLKYTNAGKSNVPFRNGQQSFYRRML